jgi:hypothetical protein
VFVKSWPTVIVGDASPKGSSPSLGKAAPIPTGNCVRRDPGQIPKRIRELRKRSRWPAGQRFGDWGPIDGSDPHTYEIVRASRLPIRIGSRHINRRRMCLRNLTVPAWRPGRRTMARGLAKSSFRTPRTQTRELRVDRFGSERTQRNEVLSRKTGRQAKFCWTLA